ncbi:hypothetical protein J6TS1_39350 [Siminovitchia terrae]|uniref:Uncharacterized protein n=1 Tax=Siminovitchia terrae TaxID=1914933 RepID=A0ABQ4L1B7_SIMTE|nr:hypothetical protein J6TS1_39350 [Siminovitchia terrae]
MKAVRSDCPWYTVDADGVLKAVPQKTHYRGHKQGQEWWEWCFIRIKHTGSLYGNGGSKLCHEWL